MKTNSCVRYLPLFLLLSTGLMYAGGDSDTTIIRPAEITPITLAGSVESNDKNLLFTEENDIELLGRALSEIISFCEVKPKEEEKEKKKDTRKKDKKITEQKEKLEEIGIVVTKETQKEETPINNTSLVYQYNNNKKASEKHLLATLVAAKTAFIQYALYTQSHVAAHTDEAEITSRIESLKIEKTLAKDTKATAEEALKKALTDEEAAHTSITAMKTKVGELNKKINPGWF